MSDFKTNSVIQKGEVERPLSNIHIRLQKRGGKHCLTLIEGIAIDLDHKRIAKALRKKFKTSGAVIKRDDGGENEDLRKPPALVIQLAGDHRTEVKEFLVKYCIWESPDPAIRVHGY